MDDERVPYPELVNRVERLRAQFEEMQRNYIFIRREPSASAPTSLDDGNMVLMDDGGANTKLYWKPQAALRSITFA